MGALFDIHTAHLTSAHISYFLTWDSLIDLEKNDMQHLRKEIWAMSGPEREKLGRCYSRMIIDKISTEDSHFFYSFCQSQRTGNVSLLFSDNN
jgi:hypothetical protein